MCDLRAKTRWRKGNRTLINVEENGVELVVENEARLERCIFKIEKRFID